MPDTPLPRTRQSDPLRRTAANFDLIGFDGDDTLWHNERVYRMGRARFHEILANAGVNLPEQAIDDCINRTELRNLTYYGYGVMSFVLSSIEASIELTDGRIAGVQIGELLQLSREMLTAEIELFDGAQDAVAALAAVYPLVLITKGDLLHQRAKVEQSGLSEHFHFVEVVSGKSADTYASILERYGVEPGRFLMIGNSLRSDVLPVLDIGGWAVHIPAHLSWAHEDGDPPHDAAGRYVSLDGLQDLPSLVRRLNR